ncbi:hypothetical protein AAFN75_01010 [Algibacter sp. AS12]|uniref:hypothetical protein n=1 Tax=Algibacter sp. AS12 TaxID=3135773 RepID=UPI00398BB512
MKNLILIIFLAIFTFSIAQEKFIQKGERIDPLTFEESFFSLDNSTNYSLTIKTNDPLAPIEFETDKYGNDAWVQNYIDDIDRIDYKYVGEISKNYHALIIRFTGGTLSNAKIIILKKNNDQLEIIGTKKIDHISKSGIIANYKFIHIGKDEHLVSDLIGYELRSNGINLEDSKYSYKLKKYKNLPFINQVYDAFTIETKKGQPIFTFFSFEKFNFLNQSQNRIEKLTKNESIKLFFGNGKSLILKFESNPVTIKKELRKLIISNSIYLSNYEIELLSKNKIIAIRTDKRRYIFRGNSDFKKTKSHSIDYINIPKNIKKAARKIYKYIN